MTLTSIYGLNQNNEFECVMEEYSFSSPIQDDLNNQAAKGYYIVVEVIKEEHEPLPIHVKKQAD